MADYISADHIAAKKGGFEPQRKAFFKISFEDASTNDILQLSVATCKIPGVNFEAGEIKYGNESRFYVGRVSWDDVEITFTDYVDKGVYEQLDEWRDSQYDFATGAVALASDYKRQGSISLISPDGKTKRTWTIIGAWIMKLDPGGGDMGAGTDANMISCTLKCDRVIPVK